MLRNTLRVGSQIERLLMAATCTTGLLIGAVSFVYADETDPESAPASEESMDAGVSELDAATRPGDEVDDAVPASDASLPEVDASREQIGYFANATANGTGCPAGTWDTSISVEGDEVSATFSAFEHEVSPSSTVAVKDCQLNIALHMPPGLSFAPRSYLVEGYAVLEDGVNLRMLTNAYFSGTPSDNSEARTELQGPYDDTFLLEGLHKDLVFSPCGKDRNLQFRVTGRLQNSQPPRDGYFSVKTIRIFGKGAWRRCVD